MFTVDRRHNDGPPDVTVPIQMNPVHALTFCSFNLHFNVILPSTPTLLSRLLSSRFSTKTPTSVSLRAPYVPRAMPVSSSSISPSQHFANIANHVTLTASFSPTSFYFLSLRSKYFPQHSLLEHPQSMPFPYCERPSFTLIHSHAPHNDVSVNDGPHIRRWSHKIYYITILYYTTIVLQLPTVFSTVTCCIGL